MKTRLRELASGQFRGGPRNHAIYSSPFCYCNSLNLSTKSCMACPPPWCPLCGTRRPGQTLACSWVVLGQILKFRNCELQFCKWNTGWHITLFQTSRWHQNDSSILAWPALPWPGQNGTFVLMSTGGLNQRDVSPCKLIIEFWWNGESNWNCPDSIPEYAGDPGDVWRVDVGEELPGQPPHSLALAVHGRVRHEEELQGEVRRLVVGRVRNSILLAPEFYLNLITFDHILYNSAKISFRFASAFGQAFIKRGRTWWNQAINWWNG